MIKRPGVAIDDSIDDLLCMSNLATALATVWLHSKLISNYITAHAFPETGKRVCEFESFYDLSKHLTQKSIHASGASNADIFVDYGPYTLAEVVDRNRNNWEFTREDSEYNNTFKDIDDVVGHLTHRILDGFAGLRLENRCHRDLYTEINSYDWSPGENLKAYAVVSLDFVRNLKIFDSEEDAAGDL